MIKKTVRARIAPYALFKAMEAFENMNNNSKIVVETTITAEDNELVLIATKYDYSLETNLECAESNNGKDE